MNEAETRAELIDPALREAGWGIIEGSRTRREQIVPGRLIGGGRRAPSEWADYVLTYRGHKLAVIEAKAEDEEDTAGVHQAKTYAEKLGVRFTYSTNGRGIYEIDMKTAAENHVDRFPTPDELWTRTHEKANSWRNRFAAIPFEDRGGAAEPRYFQHTAVEKVLEAIAAGEQRILLTLATGTGKTFIAFQIAWKLFKSHWNLSREPTRLPRILFLADRNNLADQAFNEFSSFDEDARIRIEPKEIRKAGHVPLNASIFFTIYQTFMSGKNSKGKPEPYFGEYPEDFFDFIVIDECHRGGAKDESRWRGILDYFSCAVQLGMTATPRRTDNVDTYEYFGEPVFVYSLKEGINDGFLTPFRVKQVGTSLDEYVYTSDDLIIEGEPETGHVYTESEMNRRIEIQARERNRVDIFMKEINQNEKTIVFCATQRHALMVRDMINQVKKSKDVNYCVRVTADDGKLGDYYLRTFRDNEKTIPTILTTSVKLSTGVDARNIRNIVLMRPVNNMIEFKQIIGRGTRVFNRKDYFTVYDFVKAHQHFNDPEWDGEPAGPDGPGAPHIPQPPKDPTDRPELPEEDEDGNPTLIKVKLADGKEREIQHMIATSFWSPDGTPISAAQFIERMFGDLPAFFKDEDELRRIWIEPNAREDLIKNLEAKGYGPSELTEISYLIDAENSDVFDVLAYIAFGLPTMTRETRANGARDPIVSNYNERLQLFLDFVLSQYVHEGVSELALSKLPDLLQLKYGTAREAVNELGDAALIRETFVKFQQHLYDDNAST